MQELPALQQVYEQYAGRIDMLAVAVDESGDPQKYFADNNFTIPLVKDVDGSDVYSVRGIPRTLIIDQQGDLAQEFTGGISSAELEIAIKGLLKP